MYISGLILIVIAEQDFSYQLFKYKEVSNAKHH